MQFPALNYSYDQLEMTSHQLFQNIAWPSQTMLSIELVNQLPALSWSAGFDNNKP